eukprot:COSAG02_NODE_4114_length_5756_cov_2.289376_2_plen_164_part_00
MRVPCCRRRAARNMALQLLLLAAATFVPSAAAVAAPLTRPAALPADFAGVAPPAPPTGCHGGPCGGMAQYPVGPGIEYYAEFDVPGKPKKTDGICFYIYFNIFFSGKGDGGMNQCVLRTCTALATAGSPAHRVAATHLLFTKIFSMINHYHERIPEFHLSSHP